MAGVATEITSAWMFFKDAATLDSWREDNPGEYEKISDYFEGATMPKPSGIKSNFGLGLLCMVNAGKYGDGSYPEPTTEDDL